MIGSTAFPKPITFTANRLIELAVSPWFGERDLTGRTFALHSTPMFHAMGSMATLWAVSLFSTKFVDTDIDGS